MSDLSHWDFAATFTSREAAALILSFEPDEAWREESGLSKKVGVVYERMRHDFRRALEACMAERKKRKNDSFDAQLVLPSGSLLSVEVSEQFAQPPSKFSEYLQPAWSANLHGSFVHQVFTRATLEAWVSNGQIASAYDFSGARKKAKALADATPADEPDPADLPDELYAANVAFRAVSNGHGDVGATFKNRLLQYLRANFDFSDEAIGRIATVANPDKSVGRKKSAI